jgi:hypothetical protein
MEGVDWIHLAQDRDQRQTLANTVMNGMQVFSVIIDDCYVRDSKWVPLSLRYRCTNLFGCSEGRQIENQSLGLKMAVFWVVAPCSLVEVYQRFRGPCCLHHQGDASRGATTQKTAIFVLIAVRTSNPNR